MSAVICVLCTIGSIPDKPTFTLLNYTPLFLQITCLINAQLFNTYLTASDSEYGFKCYIASAVFDFITKATLCYYICIRLVVTMRLKSKWTRLLWKSIIGFSILICFFADIVGYLPLLLPSLTPFEAYFMNIVVYIFSGFFVTCVEVFTIFAFCSTKFHTKTLVETVKKMKELGLLPHIGILVVSLCLNISFIIGDWYGIDPDFNFDSALFAIKIYVSCLLVKKMFESTVQGLSKRNTHKHLNHRTQPTGDVQRSMRLKSIVANNNNLEKAPVSFAETGVKSVNSNVNSS